MLLMLRPYKQAKYSIERLDHARNNIRKNTSIRKIYPLDKEEKQNITAKKGQIYNGITYSHTLHTRHMIASPIEMNDGLAYNVVDKIAIKRIPPI